MRNGYECIKYVVCARITWAVAQAANGGHMAAAAVATWSCNPKLKAGNYRGEEKERNHHHRHGAGVGGVSSSPSRRALDICWFGRRGLRDCGDNGFASSGYLAPDDGGIHSIIPVDMCK